MLVESPGPWGQRALPQSRGLDEAVVHRLQMRAKAAHARLLLFRRPGHTELEGGRVVYAADCRPGREKLVRTVAAGDAQLDEMPTPFDDLTGWEVVDGPLIGVCTQGKHDSCCAVRGRPVVQALAQSHPDITVEISHIGGDRFAANLLVLPGGHYLGRIPPESAPDVIDEVLAGRRPSPYYRGRSVWLMPVQAAQEFAAQALGVIDLDALPPLRIDSIGDHQWRVRFRGTDGALVDVDVEQDHGPDRARLTCHAEHEAAVPTWRCLAID